MSVLSSQAFDAALRQWLTHGLGLPGCRGARVWSSRAAGAVITCAWSPAVGASRPAVEPHLANWLISSSLQHWAQRVPGSMVGMSPQGQGLLLVPVHAQAHDTVVALQNFLVSAGRSLGVRDCEGGWELRIIGPLAPGPVCQVQRELAKRGWPIN